MTLNPCLCKRNDIGHCIVIIEGETILPLLYDHWSICLVYLVSLFYLVYTVFFIQLDRLVLLACFV